MVKFHFGLLAQFLISAQMYIFELNFTNWLFVKKMQRTPAIDNKNGYNKRYVIMQGYRKLLNNNTIKKFLPPSQKLSIDYTRPILENTKIVRFFIKYCS